MSVQVGKSIATTFVQNSVHVKTGPPIITLVDRIDFDTIYGVAVISMIWAGFFVAFWAM